MTEKLGIQSVVVGYPLLDVLSREGAPIALSQLSREAGLPPSKAHRYLVSYIRVGLVEQDPDTSRYLLGPSALRLGLAAIRRLDVLTVAEPLMLEYSRMRNECMTLAIWESRGPVVIRFMETAKPFGVNVRMGTRMPLLTSALGRVFLAWKEPDETRDLVMNELAEETAPRVGIGALDDVTRIADEVRALGYARVEASMFVGVNAVAAPIFDYQGHLTAAVSYVGPQDTLDVKKQSALPEEIRQIARHISEKLGAP